jgi:predicted nucleic-acid-binding protein
MIKPRAKAVLVDTNTVLRYLIKEPKAQYEKAYEFFERVRSGEQAAEILESVLAEIVYVLLKFYRVPKQEVVGTLSAFLGYKGIPAGDRALYLNALTLFSETSVDFVDCLLVAKAKARKIEVFSFDKELLKLID